MEKDPINMNLHAVTGLNPQNGDDLHVVFGQISKAFYNQFSHSD